MRFQRDLFSFDGMSLFYEDRFVARFKYIKRNMPGFRSFLINHFDVEEYFGRLEHHCGGKGQESPMEIMQSKGYLPNHIKLMLRQQGYEPNIEGYSLWKSQQIFKK